MNFYNYCTTITVAVLSLIVACSATVDLINGVKNNVENTVSSAASAASNAVKQVVPNCVFGVDSVSYLLFTRNQLHGTHVKIQDNEIPLQRGKPVAFIIHGFVSTANISQFYSLINTWLKKEDLNIFSVDWDDASCNGALTFTDPLVYGSAINNVPVVGKSVANFTIKLAREFGVPINEITILGHSLGAHVSGFAGKSIQQLANEKYAQIVGLDPAGILYRLKNCDEKLCASDATRVQVFHTSYTLGIYQPVGTADFYFDGGNGQPGCTGLSQPSCDHGRVLTYAEISIDRPDCFLGTRWALISRDILDTSQCNENNCAYAGIRIPQDNVQGTFYVATSSDSPYCTPKN